MDNNPEFSHALLCIQALATHLAGIADNAMIPLATVTISLGIKSDMTHACMVSNAACAENLHDLLAKVANATDTTVPAKISEFADNARDVIACALSRECAS